MGTQPHEDLYTDIIDNMERIDETLFSNDKQIGLILRYRVGGLVHEASEHFSGIKQAALAETQHKAFDLLPEDAKLQFQLLTMSQRSKRYSMDLLDCKGVELNAMVIGNIEYSDRFDEIKKNLSDFVASTFLDVEEIKSIPC
jgi:hypothetical protein